MLGNLHIFLTSLVPVLCLYGIGIFKGHKELRKFSILLGAIGISRGVLAFDIVVQLIGLARWRTYGILWVLLIVSDMLLFAAILYFILDVSGRIRR